MSGWFSPTPEQNSFNPPPEPVLSTIDVTVVSDAEGASVDPLSLLPPQAARPTATTLHKRNFFIIFIFPVSYSV